MEIKALRRSWRHSRTSSKVPVLTSSTTSSSSSSDSSSLTPSSTWSSTSSDSSSYVVDPHIRSQQTYIRPLTTDMRVSIDKAIKSAPVVLFMKGTPDTPRCGFSRASVQILGLQGVDQAKVQSFNVLDDDEFKQGIKEYSEWPTIPQLYVNRQFVGGSEVLVAMHQDGRLGRLLRKARVLAND